ncbi:shikimate O-hydroxycinnamoyltransferase [Physcomitrium patens]|uniref:Predicted protein n=1 Tax=Physcomitrium patens TaxID=3218 RepID=A9U3F9_PHYPA|nr:shikimate O-hydroxycinnamoyltransferase-like [Physcomitrium patens]PNR31758.1 hypothetical protein PHYPA_025881 [Physcomitrium patens]|eukprot:XP_024358955.1 shikimate O-hydroxycinnamoyltransferase-like [Physcomitrella patens]
MGIDEVTESVPRMRIISSKTSIVYLEFPAELHVLSCSICDNFVRPTHVRTLYLYRETSPGANEHVTTRLKAALAKLLVVFYPMAGRVRRAEGNIGYEIHCNNKGVVWVDAEVDGTIDDFENFQPNYVFNKLLVPTVDYSVSIEFQPVQIIQITKFQCGGFALGMANHHTVADGISAHNFMASWTELVRGEQISQLPNYDHHLLSSMGRAKPDTCPRELRLRPKVMEPPPTRKMVERLFTFTPEMLKKIKAEALGDGSLGSFTTFESLSAHLFRAVIRAKGCADSEEARFFTTMDARKRIKPNLPEGYFGNAIIFTCMPAKVCDILEKPLSFSAQLVRESVVKMTDEYVKSSWAWCEAQEHLTMSSINLMGNDISSAGWFRMPFYDTDFGFGKPVFAGPADNPYNGCILMLPSHIGPKAINVFMALWREDMERLMADSDFLVTSQVNRSNISCAE